MYYCPYCEHYVELLKDDICPMCFEDVMKPPKPIHLFTSERKLNAYTKARKCQMADMWNDKIGELFKRAVKLNPENPKREELLKKCFVIFGAMFRVTMYNYSKILSEKL